MSLEKLQAKFLIAAAAIMPFAPLLYLQGQRARRRVGVLPGAGGEINGVVGDGEQTPAKLFVIGESTVAGLGARSHDLAFAGQFAVQLSNSLMKPVNWHVAGKNGVTARRTIDELLPQMPDETFDYIMIGLGGNDVMKLSSPKKWRRDMIELLGLIRGKHPHAAIFLSNCPMIKYSPAIPQPIRFFLWELSKMHDANIKEFTADMPGVFYYPQPAVLRLEGFFADGLHPSEQGYANWAAAMMEYFNQTHQWKNPTP